VSLPGAALSAFGDSPNANEKYKMYKQELLNTYNLAYNSGFIVRNLPIAIRWRLAI
jgi:hypothetical protein